MNEATEALLRWASGDARSFISWGFRFGGGGDDVDGGIESTLLLLFVFHPTARRLFLDLVIRTSPAALALDLCEAKKSDLFESGSCFFKSFFPNEEKCGEKTLCRRETRRKKVRKKRKKKLFFVSLFYKRERKAKPTSHLFHYYRSRSGVALLKNAKFV